MANNLILAISFGFKLNSNPKFVCYMYIELGVVQLGIFVLLYNFKIATIIEKNSVVLNVHLSMKAKSVKRKCTKYSTNIRTDRSFVSLV